MVGKLLERAPIALFKRRVKFLEVSAFALYPAERLRPPGHRRCSGVSNEGDGVLDFKRAALTKRGSHDTCQLPDCRCRPTRRRKGEFRDTAPDQRPQGV